MHLTWADIEFDNGRVNVTAKPNGKDTIAWSPKDYESRSIPLPQESVAMLVELHEQSTTGYAYVFLPQRRFETLEAAQEKRILSDGHSIPNNFHRSFCQLVIKAASLTKTKSLLDDEGKPSIGLHDLRRTAITNWSKNANMQTVMKLARHSNVTTTQKFYSAVTADQEERVRQAIKTALAGAHALQSDAKVTHVRFWRLLRENSKCAKFSGIRKSGNSRRSDSNR